jgi:peptidoglycan-associated lipoprotein
MKARINPYAVILVLYSIVLAGCSSTAVEEEVLTEIGDTTVQAAQVKTIEVKVVPVETDASTVFYFDFDKALLKAESRAALLEHALVLSANSRSVRLEGHADERGTREYNMALGERRAIAVKEFLVLQGIAANRIEVISYGEERAAAHGSNGEAWALNRRVELK